jgi:hypothetical protein|eukprot:evm.model.NODE_25306_length_10663_cov_36.015755.6
MYCLLGFFEQKINTNPLIQIVILATPTYKIVAEAINFLSLVPVHVTTTPIYGNTVVLLLTHDDETELVKFPDELVSSDKASVVPVYPGIRIFHALNPLAIHIGEHRSSFNAQQTVDEKYSISMKEMTTESVFCPPIERLVAAQFNIAVAKRFSRVCSVNRE